MALFDNDNVMAGTRSTLTSDNNYDSDSYGAEL